MAFSPILAFAHPVNQQEQGQAHNALPFSFCANSIAVNRVERRLPWDRLSG
jgi:hypothetical protein